ATAKVRLLRFNLCRQSGILIFELTQPANIGTVCSPDHVRKHVHVAESFPHDRVGSGGVAEDPPTSTPADAWLERFVPKLAQCAVVLGSGELLDRGLVPMVKGLLNKLAAAMRLAGDGHTLLVQVMVVRAFGSVDAQLDQQPTYFCVRETGTDN